jgi:purine-nucleoside phosphorylase
MLITDHLNLCGTNPLVGPNEDALGPRFPDMTAAYDAEIASFGRKAADEVGVPLHEGVYAAFVGPNYETPAEVRMARALGASAVGMSTVPEVIALRHMAVRVGAMSCITNLAAGLSPTPLDHREVQETAAKSRKRFAAMLTAWIGHIGRAVTE